MWPIRNNILPSHLHRTQGVPCSLWDHKYLVLITTIRSYLTPLVWQCEECIQTSRTQPKKMKWFTHKDYSIHKVHFFDFFGPLGFGKLGGILSIAVHVLTAGSSLGASSSVDNFLLMAFLLTEHPRARKWSITLQNKQQGYNNHSKWTCLLGLYTRKVPNSLPSTRQFEVLLQRQTIDYEVIQYQNQH